MDGRRVEICPPPVVKAFMWLAGIMGTLITAGVAGILSILLSQSSAIATNAAVASDVRDDVRDIKEDVERIDERLDRVRADPFTGTDGHELEERLRREMRGGR